jgi:ABC-2 type transport system permease protein
MNRILTLARKDLLETRRDRLSAIFIIIMPLAFTAFFGLLFGGGNDRLPLAVYDADGGAQAKQLVAALDDSKVVRVVEKDSGDFETWMADGRAAAGLVIPAGFSTSVEAGRPAQITIVTKQGSSGAVAATTEVRALAGRIAAANRAAQIGVDTALAQSRKTPLTGAELDAQTTAAMVPARIAAAQALDRPVVSVRAVQAGAAAGQVPNSFVLSSPGMMINFIMFSLMTAGIALITERRNGTLQRLMTTRLRRTEMIAGKMGGMFALTFVQQIILIGAGQLVFGVDYLRDPAALLLMMVSLSLVASSLGLLLASVLTSEQALVATVVIVSMSVSALSGAWFPLEITGPVFRFVGHLLPTAWILDGLRGIIVRGFDVRDVLPAFAVALAWSAALFAVAASRFRLTSG